MLKHVINREDGESPPDGGMSARLRAEAAAHELCVPQPNSAESPISAQIPAVVPVSSPESGGGEASKGTNQTSTSGKPVEAYETQSDDSWATILKNTGVTIQQQRDFLRWLQKHFNIGTSKECKRAEKTGTGTWFKSPIGGKTRSTWSIPKGTKFPIPSGAEWDKITKKRTLKERDLRHMTATTAVNCICNV
jgi:hypothetical protein